MSARKDGGPAFPSQETTQAPAHAYGPFVHNGPSFPVAVVTKNHEGMTLRDYFAAKALQAIIQTDGPNRNAQFDEADANRAYKYADAMLRAREAS
ncbi:hypothetical protein [Caballeronia zhejiangensis]|uniref:Gp38 n=1 Tax=Caballeronia zhejiangensis TaxID=871203 RepID=A0A656Q9K2_9BURK|nr:hypothetical protein [Caballeronia zhejiangensis]KDR25943.1 hypothetical protein BG60_26305 [Caballeronia zhejiangensis]